MRKLVLTTTVALLFLVQINSQDVTIPQIGVKAPSFSAESTNGKIKFPSDFGKSWKILLSHPKDFTPVCSSEILELAHAQKSFEELGTKLLVVSTDEMEQHKSWKAALEEIEYQERDAVKIDFPLVADNDLKVANLYGMIHSASSISQNIRGVYFIDPENTVRAVMFYPNEVGRNVDELQRTLIALQTTDANANRVTPANWHLGDDMIVPVLSEEDKKKAGTPASDFYQLSWFLTFEKAQ